MPNLPRVDTCCCCCSTETGAKIIGWLSAVFGAFGAIGYISLIVTGSAGILGNITGLIIMAIMCLLGIFLLLGVYKDNDDNVRLWVTGMIVFIAFEVVSIIVNIILWIIGKLPATASINIVGPFIHAYFVIVVNSYRLERDAVGV